MFADALHHHRAGRLIEAERLYREVLASDPNHAHSLHLLGVVSHLNGRHEAGVGMVHRAIAIDAAVASYHSDLGNMLRQQGRLDEAIVSLRRAVDLEPDLADSHHNLGIAHATRGQLPDAVACYRAAIELNPDQAEAHNDLGHALMQLARFDEAAACYRQALDLRPDYAEAHNNLGHTLVQQVKMTEAVACLHRAIQLQPEFVDAHFNLSAALLSLGNMEAGWAEYEWRWKTPAFLKHGHTFRQPQWRGEPAAGRTLLVHAEGGFGDTLQFCRYASLAAAKGLRVILEVQRPLVRLLRGLPGADMVVARGAELPPFDLHCPMLSMPLAFRTTLGTVPATPFYVCADEAQVMAWKARLGPIADQGLRIGLVWAGNPLKHTPSLAAMNHRRSLAPERQAPLFEVAGLHFVSLQKGGPAAPEHLPLTDFMAEMADFADTAALIANLDLIIAVDTAVAHLAAALGKPVWLLDRFDPCWRWLQGRRDSPWYPTLRIYRQPRPGDWDAVLAEIVRDLRVLADERGARRAEDGQRVPATEISVLQPPRPAFTEALKHHRAGRLAEAEQLYVQALAEDPRHADSLHLLGVVTHQMGRNDLAMGLIGKAIAINAAGAAYHSNLGAVFKAQGRLDEAASSYRRALEIRPGFPEAHYNLGNVLKEQGRCDEAVGSYREALLQRPAYPEAYYGLGILLQELDRWEDATACFHRALAINPDYAEAHNVLGSVLRRRGELAQAIACYSRALDLKPDFPEAHTNRAMALLAYGDMTAGWEEYEWRWKTPQGVEGRRDFSQPRWRGEAAAGRTLLVHAEQGFGDTLQFCRYATLAAATGLRVIIEAPQPLVRLLRTLPGVDLVVGRGMELPSFDLHCPMLSMPLAFETTLETIPATQSYLCADEAQVAAWRTRLSRVADQALRVGLVWAGNPRSHSPALAMTDRRRSLAPERLAPLFEVAGLHFVSLQKGGPAPPEHIPLTDFMGEMADFADTAALIANLDLVIAVDTAVAHLAAALGKPVWLLDRFDPCWRWLTGRRDSPWYPTLRIYRQPRPGDWDAVLAEIVRDLRGFAEAGRSIQAERQSFAEALGHHRAGRLDVAERLYRLVLSGNPRHADSLHLLGVVAQQTARHDLAVAMIGEAIAIDPTVAAYHSNLGIALRKQGRPDAAAICLRTAIGLDPDFPDAHSNLGNLLRSQGRLEDAAACYRRAVDLRPDFPEALQGLGNTRADQGQYEDAVGCFRRVLAIRPDHLDAHLHLGNALKEQERLDEAVVCYRTTLALKPDYPVGHLNLGNALKEQGRLAEAVGCYRRALQIEPDYADAHNNLAMALLGQGDLAAGWEEYEWRWKTSLMTEGRRDFKQPQWRGEPAQGRTLLVHAEQGFGDTLQFCRYATLAAERGLRVILEVQKPLVRLLRDLPGVDLVVGRGADLPPFDLHCPMLSMPLVHRTTLASIPACSQYLRADREQAAAWRPRIDALAGRACRIGLAWAGNPDLAGDRRRSLALDRLAPLFGLPGVHFVSLQKGGPAAPEHIPLTDFMGEMADFADTAALIANLDLVIAVDTAAAHLAAALGKPVWLLDRFDPCWRWLAGRRDSPWYPTLRIYRQPRPGDWDAVLAEMLRDLRVLADQHEAGRAEQERQGAPPTRRAAPSPSVLLPDALQHHRAGRLEEAEHAYRRVLAIDPHCADGLHLLGVVNHQMGRDLAAIDLIGEAVALNPTASEYHSNLAAILQDQGRHDDAIACLRRVVDLKPHAADAHNTLGITLKNHGRLDDAIASYRRALELAPDLPGVHNNLGIALQEQERMDQAITCFRAALRLKPDFSDAHLSLGCALEKRGDLDEAVACYRAALLVRPNFPEVHNNLGIALGKQGRAEDAIAHFRAALDLKADFPDAQLSLGYCLEKREDFDGAIDSYRAALASRPNFPEALNNLGNVFRQQGRLDDCIACYREALDLRHEFPDAHHNFAMALLARGDMAEGWKEYEWRWKATQSIGFRRDFKQPRWDGEAASGQTLLIHAEQGLGDTLQFCRYAPLAAARGLRVIMEVQWPLVRLLRGLPGIDRVMAHGEALPGFDLHCPMLSLPLALDLPGPAPPYLRADAAAAAGWRTRLDGMDRRGSRIGIVWAGNPGLAADRRRSLAPERLASLFAVPGLHFLGLQKDGPSPPEDLPLTDFMAEMTDFADTAALIANLDLVIAVDTAVVHLAAALGKPVWLLDRFDPCWRWLAGRRDSPWYPTLRIYRQPRPGDWDAVLAEIVRDLRGFAENHARISIRNG